MSVNKVILVGRLGKDPEVRYMTNGDAVANFTLATTESFKDKEGNKAEKTEWHNVVIYRRLAEVAGEYLKKGSQIYIEGKIQTRKYQNKDKEDRYTTEVIVSEMHMLGGKGSAVPAAGQHDSSSPAKVANQTGSNTGHPSAPAINPDDYPF